MNQSLRLTSMILLLGVSEVCAVTNYVSLQSPNPTPPYVTWATAARSIHKAVGAAAAGDAVLVTNGVYAGGVVIGKALRLQSVNGPQFTVISCNRTSSCVSLTYGASLSGFTLTNGLLGVSCGSGVVSNCVIVSNTGGGASGGTLYNCQLTGNSNLGLGFGGGASFCTLYNCRLRGNSAGAGGGGASGCTLYNCTLTGNSADFGGGVYESTLYNCIVYANTARLGGANYDNGYNTLNYCCTTPLPTNGVGNITLLPRFVDYAKGNLRPQSNSPCINAGNNAYATMGTDLDGKPRVVSGTVDMGAYEFQGIGSRISYAWLQQYGLPENGSADFIDSDHDGLNNWQEWVSGTCPTNAASALRLLAAVPTGTSVTITWQSAPEVNYFLERSTTLSAPFKRLASLIIGQAGTTSYDDTNAAGPGPFFYRVGVTAP